MMRDFQVMAILSEPQEHMTKAQRGTCEVEDTVRVGQTLAEVLTVLGMKGVALEASVDLDLTSFSTIRQGWAEIWPGVLPLFQG